VPGRIACAVACRVVLMGPGRTGSDSSARIANTGSWTRQTGSPATTRSLRTGERAARDVIARPGLPCPSRLGPSRTARLYWLASDVLDWMRGLAAPGQSAPTAITDLPMRDAAPMLNAVPTPTERPARGVSEDDALAVIGSLPTVRRRVAA